MKVAFVVLVLGVAGALAVADRAGRAPLPRPVAAVPAAPVVTAAPQRIVLSAGDDEMVAADPRTLRPVAARVPAPDTARGVLSPRGTRVALPHHTPGENFVRVFDVRRNRMGARIALGGEGNASHLTWLSETRLALFTSWIEERGTLLEIDAVRGAVISRHRTASFPVAAARSPHGLVALLAPPGRIGRPKLLIGRRSLPLHGLRAGIDRSGEVTRSLWPALAVDPEGDAAYVIDAGADRFGVVDLVSETTRTGLPFGPVAKASKLIDSRRREAVWLGQGRIAISGSHDTPDGRIEPDGLRILDAAAQRQFMLAPDQSVLAASGSRVLAWGDDGLTVFGAGAAVEHRVLRGTQILHVELLGHFAYAHANRRIYVVDVRSGKVVARVRRRHRHLRATASGAREPVLGVDYPGGPRGRIALWDPVTLKRVGRRAVVSGHLWGSDRSPSGGGVALGVSNRGRIQIFGTRPVAFSRTIETGRRESIIGLRWVTAERLIALTHDHLLEVDLAAGRVARRHALGGQPTGWAKTADGLAVLTDRALSMLRPGEAVRRIPHDVRARVRTSHDLRRDLPPDLFPGLAVIDGVAYVADAEAPRIVRIDLASGAAGSHALRAAAAKGGAARTRALRAVGSQLLLGAQDLAANGRIERETTQLIDPAGWTVRTIGGPHSTASDQGIVIADYRRRYADILSPEGRRLTRFRPRFGLSNVEVHGRYAYIRNGARRGHNHRTHVIDLRTGRKIGSVPTKTLPHLLP